jgi:hypothetical protein
MTVHTIRTFKPGDMPSAREANDAVEALRGHRSFGHGWHNPLFSASGLRPKQDSRWVVGFSGVDTIPPYSVFGVTVGLDTLEDMPKFQIAELYDDGESTTLFTNGPLQIDAGTHGFVRPIGHGEAIKLKYTGAAPTGPGAHMGVRPGTLTLETAASKYRHGFVAICWDSDYVWAVRADNNSFVCKTTETITARSGDTLGEGNAEVYRRAVDSSNLVELKQTGETSDALSFKLFNIGPSVASGTYVLATGVVGIGLVIERVVGSDLKGAFSIGGDSTPHETGSPLNLIFDSANHNDDLVSFEPHATLSDKYIGVEIQQRGRWAIFCHLAVACSSADNDGTIMMEDGVDLMTKFERLRGLFTLTVNDDPVAPTGGPSLISRFWNFESWSASAESWCFLDLSDIFWFEQDDTLRLYFQHNTAADASIGIYFGMWGFYYGDYATEWTPDGAIP